MSVGPAVQYPELSVETRLVLFQAESDRCQDRRYIDMLRDRARDAERETEFLRSILRDERHREERREIISAWLYLFIGVSTALSITHTLSRDRPAVRPSDASLTWPQPREDVSDKGGLPSGLPSPALLAEPFHDGR